MANKPIHEQGQALSAYFNDMLTAPTAVTPTKVAIEPKTAMPANDDVKAEAEVITEAAPAPPKVIERPDSLRVLLCDIDGVTLAVPIAFLNNIIRWPEQGLTALPEQAQWQLGVINQAHDSQVIDIRHLLQTANQSMPLQANYIVVVDERRWGIACHQIKQIVTYQAEAINWRDDLSQPAWSQGVIGDSLYHIVDIPALLLTLEQSYLA